MHTFYSLLGITFLFGLLVRIIKSIKLIGALNYETGHVYIQEEE